jgi:hypothetical protein
VATEQVDKEEIATDFYLQLLGRPRPREFDLDLDAVGMQPVDLAGLEAHFSDEEVWAAVRSMPANKSPGPDGFS